MFSCKKRSNNHMVIDAEAMRKLDAVLKKYFKNIRYTATRKDLTQFQTCSLDTLLTEPNRGRKKISTLQIDLDKKTSLGNDAFGTISFNSRYSDTILFPRTKKPCFQSNIRFEDENKGKAFEKELQDFAETCFHSKFAFILENIICYLASAALTAIITYITWTQLFPALYSEYSMLHVIRGRRVIGGLTIVSFLSFFIFLFFYDNHRICTSVHFKWHKKKETDSTHKNRNAPSA